MGILVIVFTVINWIIYHHIFQVTYFGGAFGSILKELFGCMVVACIELAILQAIGSWILGGVITIGKWILRVVLIIALVILAIYLIYTVWKIFKPVIDALKQNKQKKI